MRHKLFAASCMVAIAVIGAAPAYANKGGPSNACGNPAGPISANAATSAPGNSATSPGSTHNEPVSSGAPTTSMLGGKGGAAYSSAGGPHGSAPSQYDNSCANVTANSTNPNGMSTGAGTPIQQGVAPLPTQVPNNSLDTRTASGVTSHTGKGATK